VILANRIISISIQGKVEEKSGIYDGIYRPASALGGKTFR